MAEALLNSEAGQCRKMQGHFSACTTPLLRVLRVLRSRHTVHPAQRRSCASCARGIPCILHIKKAPDFSGA